jgi:hypothetical protein
MLSVTGPSLIRLICMSAPKALAQLAALGRSLQESRINTIASLHDKNDDKRFVHRDKPDDGL